MSGADTRDPEDAPAWGRIHALLDVCFSGIAERIRAAASLGADWRRVSVPFVHAEGGAPLAHVGVISIPMVVGGRERTVAGVHAVCTHPSARGRGHSTALMRQALSYVDGRHELALLTTGIPAFYERFGFRAVPENVFVIRPPAVEREGPPARPLSANDPADVRLLHRLLARRAPLSGALSSLDSGWLFLIDELLATGDLRRLHYAEDLDVVMAYEIRGGTLHLLDVVGAAIPPLGELLARIGDRVGRVEVQFTPDRIWSGPLELRPWDPEDVLMVRGDVDLPSPVALPPLARC